MGDDVCYIEETNVDQDFGHIVDQTWGSALPKMQQDVYSRKTGKKGVDKFGDPTPEYEEWWAIYTARVISWFGSQGKGVGEMAAHVNLWLARDAG